MVDRRIHICAPVVVGKGVLVALKVLSDAAVRRSGHAELGVLEEHLLPDKVDQLVMDSGEGLQILEELLRAHQVVVDERQELVVHPIALQVLYEAKSVSREVEAEQAVEVLLEVETPE